MSEGADLLRMLEPAVRPVGSGATAARPSQAPFEGKSFETLLQEVQTAADSDDQAHAPRPHVIDSLAQIGAVENASLRNLIGVRTAKSS